MNVNGGVGRDELLEMWVEMRVHGATQREVARRLGMSADSFKRALLRARAAGDPRAAR